MLVPYLHLNLLIVFLLPVANLHKFTLISIIIDANASLDGSLEGALTFLATSCFNAKPSSLKRMLEGWTYPSVHFLKSSFKFEFNSHTTRVLRDSRLFLN